MSWISSLINDVNRGESLSIALRNSKQNFDGFYCGMVEVGEQTGQLPLLLNKVSQHLESSARLNAKIRKALAYPTAVVLISITIIVSMLIWVIPTFESVFANFNSELPLPTALVIGISNGLREHLGTILVITTTILGIFIWAWNHTIALQQYIDKLILTIPYVSKLNRSALMSKWALTINSLHQSGTPLLQAIRISARCSNHWSMHETSVIMYQYLSRGFSIYEAASIANKSYRIFDAVSLQLLKIGEDSGSLPEMFTYLSKHHEKAVDDAVGVLIELLEPILITFLGIVVGGMVIALYLPLFQLGQLT